MSPRRAPRPCTQPGCPELVTSGRCPTHTRPSTDNRPSAARRGYDRAWRRVRERVLRAEPACRFCKEQGRITLATELDHIAPINEGGARLDPANLRPLCKSCHSSRTARDRGRGKPKRPPDDSPPPRRWVIA